MSPAAPTEPPDLPGNTPLGPPATAAADGPLGVGLIGFGYAGRTFHAPLVRATPGLALTAVASSDPGRVQAALGTGVAVCSVAALLARPDIALVVVATPNALHHPLALAALQAGKAVVIDKPMALDATQAAELVAVAQAGGRLLSVFHNRRWDSDFRTVRQVLAAGTLGRPVELVMHFDRFRPQVRARWREADAPGGGLWADLGPHLMDQALQLFGTPTRIHLVRAALRDGAQGDDWFDARLQWPGGLQGRLHASTLAAVPGPRFALHGTRGSLEIDGLDPQEDALKAGFTPDPMAPGNWGADARRARLVLADDQGQLRETDLPLARGDYPAYYAALRDALRGRGPNPVPAAQALAVQAGLDAGVRSAAAGRPEPWPEAGWITAPA